MLYWLIPYLVVYNVSDTGNWKYGPEHLFKVEVSNDMVIDNVTFHSEINMFIPCRPMNSSSIQCHVESATLDKREFPTDSDHDVVKYKSHEEPIEIGNNTFQVEFDKMGPRYITFLNIKDLFRQNMIRVIVAQLNIGTDLSEKKPEKENLLEEKSINGICETSFDIRKTKLRYEEEDPAAIEGFNFDVPSFSERAENESIIIEKTRKMNACSVKPNYFIGGGSKKGGSHLKHAQTIENNITRSQSIIYLGKNGFSSYTESEGTMNMKSVGMAPKIYSVKKGIKAKIAETIRLKLVVIRPTTEKL